MISTKYIKFRGSVQQKYQPVTPAEFVDRATRDEAIEVHACLAGCANNSFVLVRKGIDDKWNVVVVEPSVVPLKGEHDALAWHCAINEAHKLT